MSINVMWNGLGGEIGQEALQLQSMGFCPELKIAATLGEFSRRVRPRIQKQGVDIIDTFLLQYGRASDILRDNGVDVIVHFASTRHFTQIVELARDLNVPLIMRTIHDTDQQEFLQAAARIIPVFCDVNYSFQVKGFIDQAVAYAKGKHHVNLVETVPPDKPVNGQITQLLNMKLDAVTESPNFPMSVPSDQTKFYHWEVDGLRCDESLPEQLARDILRITQAMAHGKVPSGGSGPGGIYTLDDIWGELKD